MELLVDWANKTKNYAIRIGGKVERFTRAHKLKIDCNDVTYIRYWIRSIQCIIKNNKQIRSNDIRKYLPMKKKIKNEK